MTREPAGREWRPPSGQVPPASFLPTMPPPPAPDGSGAGSRAVEEREWEGWLESWVADVVGASVEASVEGVPGAGVLPSVWPEVKENEVMNLITMDRKIHPVVVWTEKEMKRDADLGDKEVQQYGYNYVLAAEIFNLVRCAAVIASVSRTPRDETFKTYVALSLVGKQGEVKASSLDDAAKQAAHSLLSKMGEPKDFAKLREHLITKATLLWIRTNLKTYFLVQPTNVQQEL